MENDFPLCVVIPTYNRAELLGATLESVFAQSIPCAEVIVVDDGSTDATPATVRRWGNRLTYVPQENRGVAAARNHGLRLAESEWVTFLDSDDLWSADKVSADRAAWLRVPEAKVLFGGKRTLRGGRLSSGRAPELPSDVLPSLALENALSVGAVTARRSCWLSVGGFDEDRMLGPSADWDLWVRLAARYSFTPTGAASLWVREHPDNMMHDPARMERAMAAAVEHFLADTVAGPKLASMAGRIRGRRLLFSAVGYYGSGDTSRARDRLRAARRTDPAVALHPLWPYTFVRSLLGRRLSSLLRRSKRAVSGIAGSRHEVVLH
jgi:glycosyltransferase involved in cell wall biosynthesis